MRHLDDESLVAECLNENQRAWTVLVDRYKQLIYSVPLKYGLGSEEAADIFQAVCLELYTNLAKLRQAGAIRGWLVTVAARQCFHWKKRARKFETFGGDPAETAGETNSGADLIGQVEREQILREALEDLPPRCRKMIKLLFWTDPPRPYAEVARELGLAVGSIGFIRGRCLEKLRQKLLERGFHS